MGLEGRWGFALPLGEAVASAAAMRYQAHTVPRPMGKRILKRLVDGVDRSLLESETAASMTAQTFFVLAARTAL